MGHSDVNSDCTRARMCTDTRTKRHEIQNGAEDVSDFELLTRSQAS